VQLRKIIFWLHLTAGVVAGVVIFIMSVTGVVLMYQKQLTEWADRKYWPSPAVVTGQGVPVAELVRKAAEAQPEGKPSAVTFYSDPSAPAVIAVGPGQNVFVNRYNGAATIGGSTAVRSLFKLATDWHRYLGTAGDNRSMGKTITGACNLAFLFIVCSGIYLWWPRTWTRQSLRSVTWFKGGLKAKARDFNWHNVFGFWTAVPLFLIVLSGVVISYPWASNMVYKVSGSAAPVRNQPRGAQERNVAASADLGQADAFLARVEQQVEGWRSINLRLPAAGERQVTFSVDKSFGGRPQMRSTIVFDKKTGEIMHTQTFASQTAGERARSWMRFVHTGEFYGVAGQTIAGIASGAAAMLVFTGLSLAVRRLSAWNARKPVRAVYMQEQAPIPASQIRNPKS
jgi:uncharacterized iron-regulated membrane protein